MRKRCRLKINYSEIKNRADFERAKEIIEEGIDGKIFILDGGIYIQEGTVKRFDFHKFIKKSWLTEIKEPLSFEEWNKSKNIEWVEIIANGEDGNISLKDVWNACLENQKLGVVDEEKDHEAFKKFNTCTNLILGEKEFVMNSTLRSVWSAALKYARGNL